MSISRIPGKKQLAEYDSWIVWREEERDGKLTKPPRNPITGGYAQSNNPDTWTDLETAIRAYGGGNYNGIGFMFSEADPFCGIDLDNCRDPETGDLEPWAARLIRRLASYTEISPSGRGFHIIITGQLNKGGRRTGNLPAEWEAGDEAEIEIYDNARYFTVTGDSIGNVSDRIEERQGELDELIKEVFPQERKESNPARHEAAATLDLGLSDRELIDKAMSAKNGDTFSSLWKGNTSGYGGDHSRADQALCNLLAFWTDRNPQRMDRLFRQSGLMRPKWDKKHYSNGDTYSQRTIQKAIESTTEGYRPPQERTGGNGEVQAQPKATEEESKAKKKSEPADRFFDGKSFNQKRLAEDIMGRYNFRHCYQDFWVYDNGVYRREGERVIEQQAQELLGRKSSRYRINETKNFIKIASYADPAIPSKELINLKNGRLNWRTGELLPHNPNNFEITQLPVEYDPAAECPQFERYLETTLDADVIPLALEIMGLCLVPDVSFEKTVMLVGEGANGKGVFLDLMTYLLGRENVLGAELQELVDNRFRAAELLGKLANISADIGSHRMENTGRFKMLVSGDFLQVERKHQDPFNFRNHARLLFSANEIPGSRDRTYAYYRRWIIIPFTRTFEGKAADKNLRKKLRAELPGIFNKALEGLRRLKKNDEFTQPKQVKDQLDEYKRQNDSVAAFVAECCEVDRNRMVIKQKFYNAYKGWCEAQGLNPVSQRKVATALPRAVEGLDEMRTNAGSGPRAWVGVDLK